MRPYGEPRQRKSQLFAFCLLSNLTRRGSNGKKGRKKGANVSGGGDGMGAERGDTDGVGGGHFVDFIVGFSSASTHTHTQSCSAHIYRHTHIYQSSGTPQREVIRGCPLQTHPPPPHLRPPPSLILLCHCVLPVSATKTTVK